ncbi:MAG: TolC family protein [Candidatus Riflebacteria bacterium]|nr:TolC family protein [Candidatus Riflebacteria bacterium]
MKTVRHSGIALAIAALILTASTQSLAQGPARGPKAAPEGGPARMTVAASPSPGPAASPSSAAAEAGEAESAVLSGPESRGATGESESAVLSAPESGQSAGRPGSKTPAEEPETAVVTSREEPDDKDDEETPSTPPSPAATSGSLAGLPPVTTTANVIKIRDSAEVLKIDLNQAIGQALSLNPGLKAYARDVDAARWRYYQQRAQVTPRLDGWKRYTAQTEPAGVGQISIGPIEIPKTRSQAGDLHDHGVQLKHTIYTFGRQHNSLKQRKHETQSYRDTLGDGTDELILDVKKAFYSILLQKALIDAAEQSLKELKVQHDFSLARFEQGAATEYDVLLARSKLANARPDLIKAVHDIESSCRSLLSLMGIEGTVEVQLAGDFDDRPLRVPFRRCLESALANRQDLRSLMSQRQSLLYSVKALRANHYPTLSTLGTLDSSKGSRAPLDNYVEFNSLYFTLDVPLYDGGLSRAQAREARAKVAKVDEQIGNLKLDIRSKVTDAYLQVEQAMGNIEAALEGLSSSTLALANAEEAFQSGVRTTVEVLSAQTELSKARSSLAQARYDHSVAKATLSRVAHLELLDAPAPASAQPAAAAPVPATRSASR